MSRTATHAIDCSWFFSALRASPRRVLFADYDGTVAPFHADRYRAMPYPNIPEFLRCIMSSCGTRLIVISARAAREVPRLLGLSPQPEIWGTHGIEKIDSVGRYEEVHVSEAALAILAEAESQLEDAGLGAHVEVKLAGVALHWRGLAPASISEIKRKAYRILKPLAAPPELLLSEFEEGLEIRLASASKGNALRDFLSKLDSSVPVAYLGDDATDEEAFQVLNGRGLSVLVGSKPRSTNAQIWLRPPDELLQFLMHWIRACGARE